VTRDERGLLRGVRRLAKLPAAERRAALRLLTVTEKRTLDEFWPAWAHEGQSPPAGDWPTWLMVTGRGFGKTRAGAEWVSALARDPSTSPFDAAQDRLRTGGALRIALVGATIEDALKVMVNGQSGLIAVARTGERVTLYKSAGVSRRRKGLCGRGRCWRRAG
jgi:phage terminase large subunit-like protein